MTTYKLSNLAKEDLIRIHKYGTEPFGMNQADTLFENFDIIAENPSGFSLSVIIY